MQLSSKKLTQFLVVTVLLVVIFHPVHTSGALATEVEDSIDQEVSTDGQPGFLAKMLSFLALERSEGAQEESKSSTGKSASEEVDAVVLEPLRPVELFMPAQENSSVRRQFFGKVVARETAALSFPLSGTLQRFPIKEGQIVEKGDLLAELDLASFSRAKERARINLEQAERQLARENRLIKNKVVSERRVEETQTARDLADVALRDAKDALEDATLSAPYRALISERLTANHVIVAPGTPIVEVHDISSLRVEIELPERLLTQVSNISSIEFSAVTPGQLAPTKLSIAEFQPKTGPVGQTFTLSLELPEEKIGSMLPGVSLSVTAEFPIQRTRVALPSTAISADENRQTYVMVFEPKSSDEGVVRKQLVDVTTDDGLNFLVADLPPSTEIVRVGTHLLRDGQQVRRYHGLVVGE